MRLVFIVSKSKLLLIFSALLGISNIFLIANYQSVKRSNKAIADDTIDQTLSGDLRRLQFEINETFRRFEERERVTGKAFERAAPTKTRKEYQLKQDFQPPSPDCKQTPFLLIQIHSTPGNFKEREAIRVSWGTPENNINKANAGKQLMPR